MARITGQSLSYPTNQVLHSQAPSPINHTTTCITGQSTQRSTNRTLHYNHKRIFLEATHYITANITGQSLCTSQPDQQGSHPRSPLLRRYVTITPGHFPKRNNTPQPTAQGSLFDMSLLDYYNIFTYPKIQSRYITLQPA